MASLRNKRNNSLPSINMNKFFVSKRASMFEAFEETPREKRERSPCGYLEISERKLEARKEKERKEAMVSRKKRQADPYAEESTEVEDQDEQLGIESKICPHSNRSVNLNLVRKSFKQLNTIGECTSCRRSKESLNTYNNTLAVESAPEIKKASGTVIWLCCYCGHQGCDRNSRDKHAYHHYKAPRSDPHCVIINVHTWTVWCYECDCEAILTSSKKLYEAVNFVKRQSEMAPRRSINAMLPTTTRQHTTNLTTQFSGSDSRLHLSSQYYEDTSKASKNTKNYQASVLAALPKAKGLSNLGNTCFFNSVIQNLSQTHYLTQILDIHCQKGQKIMLPGRRKFPSENDKHSKGDRRSRDSSRYVNGESRSSSESEVETEDTIELCAQGGSASNCDLLSIDGPTRPRSRVGSPHPTVIRTNAPAKKASKTKFSSEKPLDLYLSEGGTLGTSLAVLMKEMHCVGKSITVNPGHLFGLICKKSTQFQGFQQQDAHELLRCLLDAVRNEEIIRIKKSILRSFGYSEKTDPNSVPSRLKKVIKGYGKQASHTIIEEIFGGQLISTVFCEECHRSSQVFEPFMDLSLPINEEKGKPKKSNSLEDDGIFDCFGRSSNTHASNSHTSHISKYQNKKNRKMDKKKKKTKQKTSKCESTLLPCIKVNVDERENEQEKVKKTKRQRRLTEKRRPEEMEEFRLKEEAEKKAREERRRALQEKKKRSGESNKFKMLTQARSSSKKEVCGEELEGGESGEEEEQEYDPDEEDEDDDSFGIERKSFKHRDAPHPTSALFSSGLKSSSSSSSSLDDEEEEDEEEIEDEEDEEEETEGNDTSSDASSTKNSKTLQTSRENSDADVEDNTDSEYMRNSFRQSTRQPSIVIDESVSDHQNSDHIEYNNRYLRTSHSYDQLNYNSCSDTSERYFTAAGGDTMDELDHGYGGDTISLMSDRTSSTLTSSGKGDSISMSSGDLYCHYDDHRGDRRLIVDQGHMDEMCLKVSELRIQRKSSSKEDLLDSNPKSSCKRRSTETLHTFNSDRINEEEPILKKGQTIKKLKQEWISRSLATLAPRYQSDRQECSVMSCLANFTSPELLTGNNKITCEDCSKLQSYTQDKSQSVKSNASKQLLILSPPAVLTLHLKRFHHVGYNLCKVNRYVRFPVVLDLAPFTSAISLGLGNMSKGQSQVLYTLYGVVEHSGRLNAGHYVAYVRSRPLDTQRTSKHFLNLKPSSQFEVNQLVNEMAEKIEVEGGPINKTLKPSPSSHSSVNIEEIEEEVRSGRWYHISDSYVAEVNFDKVTKAQAYLLFYERIL